MSSDIDKRLDDLALKLTLADEGDVDLVTQVRKELAAVCASDLAMDNRGIMKLAKELIRLTLIVEGDNFDADGETIMILSDGIGLLAQAAQGEKLEKPTIVAVLDRIEQQMAAGVGPGKKPAKKKTKKKTRVAPSAPVAAQESTPKVEDAPSEAAEDAPVTHTEPITEDNELYAEFLEEAAEHLQNAESSLLDLESDPSDSEALGTVFRAYHTIKGVAGFLGLTDVNRVTHNAETMLDACRKGKLTFDQNIGDVSFETIDAIRAMTAVIAVRLDGEVASTEDLPDLLGLIEKLKQATQGEQVEAKTQDETPSEKTMKVPKRGPAAAVKVDTEKLDSLVNMVGELVIAQTQVSQASLEEQLRNEKLSKDMGHLGKITNDIQEVAMSMRMIPVRDTFQKMARLVRDLGRKSGKNIEFIMSGEDTELDRNMVEEIGDPLVHILRNSVDHGLENPEQRSETTKEPKGIIELNAYHQGGNIVIEVKDDGRGLDKDKILAKGIERGLIKEGEPLSDSQIFGMIFQAGFSTADKITDVSGRGVGMDVVRQNTEKLRGKVEVSSEHGVGTTISLKLPLTLAIIDGMIVRVGHERYVIPTISIVETLRPKAEDRYTVQGTGEVVKVRGSLHPLIRLYSLFGVEPDTTEIDEALIVIVESDLDRCCLLVDELIGQQQVVIKSLGESLRGIQGISGGAILADGLVGLILDVSSLADLALRGGPEEDNVEQAGAMN